MKKINLFLFGLLSIMTFSFVSCSDDDDKGSGSASDLIGAWERVSQIHQYKENGEIVSEDTEYNDGWRIKFNKDGTYEEWKDEQWDGGGYIWEYKNGKITINSPSFDVIECEVYEVKELTSSKLVYESVEKYTEEGIDYESYYRDEYRKISE
jgi:hypothetical protein